MTVTATLQHIHGSLKGSTQYFDLDEGKSVVFGRLPSSDIPFDPLQDIKASGRHARLFLRDGRCWVEDLRSSNGTFVNGQRLEMAPVPIVSGDIIEFGGSGPRVRVVFEPHLADSGQATNGAHAADVDALNQTLPLDRPIQRVDASADTAATAGIPPTDHLARSSAPSAPAPILQTRPASSPDSQRAPSARHSGQTSAPPSTSPAPHRLHVSASSHPSLHPEPAPAPDNRSVVGARAVALMIGEAQREGGRRVGSMMMVIAAIMLLIILVLTVFIVRSKQTQADVSKTQMALDAAQAALLKTQTDLASTQQRLLDLAADRQRLLDEEKQRLARAEDLAAASLRQQRVALDATLNSSLNAMRVDVDAKMRDHFQQQQQLIDDLKRDAALDIAQRDAAIFMLIVQPNADEMRAASPPRSPLDGRPGFDDGFCTAFAIHPDGWLATNARCINAIMALRHEYTRDGVHVSFAARRSGGDASFPIDLESLHTHTLVSADLGILKLTLPDGERLSQVAPLATADEALHLTIGQPIYILGFSDKAMNPYAPQAGFHGGHIANFSDFSQANAAPAQSQLMWHTAYTSKGAGGAPIFDRQGRVVAVNSGLTGLERVTTASGEVQRVQPLFAAEAIHFGVRVDLLHDLLRHYDITPPPPPPSEGAPLR
jgi:hypothetical protein